MVSILVMMVSLFVVLVVVLLKVLSWFDFQVMKRRLLLMFVSFVVSEKMMSWLRMKVFLSVGSVML